MLELLAETFVLTLLALTLVQLAHADVTGRWQTIDDDTGEAKSIVEIYERNGEYFGKVEDLLLKPDDSVCEANTRAARFSIPRRARFIAPGYGWKMKTR